ncbi:MAG: hypothetical protein HKN40_00240 [Winogradskyella sp.]|uniref:hypothetical protein n=1 Tax=Winogradskyella sp. TaxID=1883156 RepID=UPI0017D84583|nr:hypothetical protein [Winogradskyella sp.]
MEVGNTNLSYKTKWIYNIAKNGLIWQGIRNRLAKIGFDFMPYYWEIGAIDIAPPSIRGDSSEYELSILNEDEIASIKSNIIGIAHKDLLNDYKQGDTCLAIKYRDKIAIYSFIKQTDFYFRGRIFKIKPSEGYVHHTYTFEDFRGKNLAPFLRYQSYNYFKSHGIDTYYSISEYFNKPTLKYKKKIGVKPLKLYLNVVLFKRWCYNFTLKSY